MSKGLLRDLAEKMVDDIVRIEGEDTRERRIVAVEAYLSYTTSQEAAELRETARAAVAAAWELNEELSEQGDDDPLVSKLMDAMGNLEVVLDSTSSRLAARENRERTEFQRRLREAAERVLETGGSWLGDMTEQAAEDPKASDFMSAMENLRTEVGGMGETPEGKRWFERGFDKADPPEIPHSPTKEQLSDPRFEAIFQLIKNWDVDADGKGYQGANGSHVAAIMNALDQAAEDPPELSKTKISELRQATMDFLGAWMLLPPLVRASTAIAIWAELDRRVRINADRMGWEAKAGMKRRARVTALHGIGHGHVADLMAKLANFADDEAAAAGIDSDVRYQIDETFNAQFALAIRSRKNDPRAKEVDLPGIWRAAMSVEVEGAAIDEEVLGDLEAAKVSLVPNPELIDARRKHLVEGGDISSEDVRFARTVLRLADDEVKKAEASDGNQD